MTEDRVTAIKVGWSDNIWGQSAIFLITRHLNRLRHHGSRDWIYNDPQTGKSCEWESPTSFGVLALTMDKEPGWFSGGGIRSTLALVEDWTEYQPQTKGWSVLARAQCY